MKKILLAMAAIAITLGASTTSASAATGFARTGSFAEQQVDGDVVHHRRIAVNHATGDVYVADQQQDRVSVYRPNGNGADPLTDFGTGQLTDPYGIAIDQDSGTVYVSDADGVTKYDSDGAPTPTLTADAGFATISATGPLAFDQDADELLLADTTANVVRRYSADGTAGATFDGTGSSVTFTGLQDLAVDSTGDIVVIDADGDPGTGATSRIERFDSSGAWEVTIGPVAQAATVGIVPTDDEVIVGGDQDNVNDNGSPTLTRFSADGTDLGQIAVDGSLQYSTTSGIALDNGATGRLYVATDVSAGDYAGQFGLTSVQAYDHVIVPVATAGAATGVTATTATLDGVVETQNEDSTVHFDYRPAGAANWLTTPDETLAASASGEAVDAEVAGLQPNKLYEFRVVATNRGGSHTSADVIFTTGVAAPSVQIKAASASGPNIALRGSINPNNQATNYWFEYGTSVSYGSSKPVGRDGAIGAGGTAVDVGQQLSGLQLGTTYHYRLVAENATGRTESVDRTFALADPSASCPNAAIRKQQGVERLPDCRAYEQVSPSDKGGADVRYPLASFTSADGNRVVFAADGSGRFAGSQNSAANQYLATRDGARWTTKALSPRTTQIHEGMNAVGFVDFGCDACDSVVGAALEPAAPGDDDTTATGGYPDIFVSHGGRVFDFISQGPLGGSAHAAASYAGRSADGSRIAFTVADRLVPGTEAVADGTRIAYERVNGETRVVGRDNDGVVMPGGSVIGSGPNAELTNAVSRDGSHIVFRSPDPDVDPNSHLYVRIDGKRTVEASRPRCSVPSCNGQGVVQRYVGASASGERVFFNSADRLVDNDTNDNYDLYQYDVPSDELTRVTTGVDGAGSLSAYDLAAPYVSDDGATVYFIGSEVLTTAPSPSGQQPEQGVPNLYAYRVGSGSSPDVRFIGRFRISNLFGPEALSQVAGTPDGNTLVFAAGGNGVDGPEESEQIYRYRYDANEVECVTCSAARSTLLFSGGRYTNQTAGLFIQGGTPLQRPRNVADDGRRIFFETTVAFSPADTNGRTDVYEWSDGTFFLLSSGKSPDNTYYVDASASGADVFINTYERLAHTDTDDAADVYTVRAGGGLAKPAGGCAEDACQGTPTGDTVAVDPATDQPGSGNLPTPDPRARVTVVPLKAKDRAALARGRIVALKMTVNRPGTLAVRGVATVRGKRLTALEASRKVARAGTQALRVRLSRAAGKQLSARGRLGIEVTVRFSGVKQPRRLTVVLSKPGSRAAKAVEGSGSNSSRKGR